MLLGSIAEIVKHALHHHDGIINSIVFSHHKYNLTQGLFPMSPFAQKIVLTPALQHTQYVLLFKKPKNLDHRHNF
jgi:hypothetical protein